MHKDDLDCSVCKRTGYWKTERASDFISFSYLNKKSKANQLIPDKEKLAMLLQRCVNRVNYRFEIQHSKGNKVSPEEQ